jgi:hypothetical protein
MKLIEEKSKKITNKIEQKRVSGIRLPRERENIECRNRQARIQEKGKEE